MSLAENIRSALTSQIGTGRPYPNRKRLADALDIDPSQLNRFLRNERGLSMDALEKIMEKLGWSLNLGPTCAPEAQPIVFRTNDSPLAGSQPHSEAHTINEEDYLAVPMAASPVAAGPGLIPEDRIDQWVLIWRHHEAIRFKNNLIGVTVGRNEFSMTPTLHPGDIALVDRNDTSPTPAGKIMLVSEPGPDGGMMIKRVSVQDRGDDLELVFYSDNSSQFPPMIYQLQRDYDGDITRAIAGRVVWSWSDMTKK
ncbi:MAG: LexA family transcriptional regulator [Desulfovibrio sp.]